MLGGSISTRKIVLTADMFPKITGIGEATVVRRSFVNPPAQLLSSVPSSPGPMSDESVSAQVAAREGYSLLANLMLCGCSEREI